MGESAKSPPVGFPVVMTTFLPWTQLGNQGGGGPAGARAHSVPKYAPSGKRHYQPVEMVGVARAGRGHRVPPLSLHLPWHQPKPCDTGRCMTVWEDCEDAHSRRTRFLRRSNPLTGRPGPHVLSSRFGLPAFSRTPPPPPPHFPNGPPLRF